MNKKAIVFDLNGVFIVSPRLSDRFLEDFSVPIDDFISALKDVMDNVRKPKAEKTFSLWQPYFEKWGIEFTEKGFLDYWFMAEKENVELVDIAKKLKQKGYRLFILSNNFKERADYYAENFPFLSELFEKVYYSWQTGFVKPSIEAWQKLSTENGLKSEDCIYFDDSDKNIELAKSIGVESYIFNDDVVRLLESI